MVTDAVDWLLAHPLHPKSSARPPPDIWRLDTKSKQAVILVKKGPGQRKKSCAGCPRYDTKECADNAIVMGSCDASSQRLVTTRRDRQAVMFKGLIGSAKGLLKDAMLLLC